MKGGFSEILYQVALLQGGYFTAFQARNAGIKPENHTYHVKSKNWIREWRGIYRFSQYPPQEDAQYSLWGVWSMNHKGQIQGTYSHETALSLYDLSDLQPTKLHITVPRNFRRHSKIPNILQLHYSTFSAAECEERSGYLITKPFRTIVDCIRTGTISNEFILQAIHQSLQKGYLRNSDLINLAAQPKIRSKVKILLSELK